MLVRNSSCGIPTAQTHSLKLPDTFSVRPDSGSVVQPPSGGGDTFEPAPTQLKDPKLFQNGWFLQGSYSYGNPRGATLFGATGDMGDDIEQGNLGDCGLASAVSELAHLRPDLLRQAITQNPDGTVTIRLYQRIDPNDGSKGFVAHYYTVDTKIPMDWIGDWVYGHSASNDLWFPLIEKAFASLAGGYSKIQGIAPSLVIEGLVGEEDITGDYAVTSQGSAASIASNIQSLLANGEGICACTPGSSKGLPSGLPADHAYSVDGVIQKNGQTYIQMRNPWDQPGTYDDHFLVTPQQFKDWFVAYWHVPMPAPPVPSPAEPDLPRHGGRVPR